MQAQAVFAQPREFAQATFELLEEINWRAISDLCSSLFGVSVAIPLTATARPTSATELSTLFGGEPTRFRNLADDLLDR